MPGTRNGRIALTFWQQPVRAAIADTASHHPESAVMVLRMMVDANRITPQYDVRRGRLI